MNNTAFLQMTAEQKIDEIINRVKDSIINGNRIDPVFYLFDQNDQLHVIEIEDKFLIKEDRQSILTQLIKEKISDMQKRNLEIDRVMFLREGYYNPNYQDKLNMNLDKDFNQHNANEAMIVTVEDTFNFEIKVFDLIKIQDSGKVFSVLSKEPIDNIDFCKIDPEYNISTNYINLLE